MSNEDRGGTESALGDLIGDDESDVPVPAYEAEQYLPSGTVSEDRREMFRREFGYVRAFFRSRPASYWRLQRRLNQARVGTTYDRYLSRSVTLATFAGVGGALVGVLLTVLLTRLGILGNIQSPMDFGTGALVRFVAENEVVVGGAALALVLSLLGFAAVWLARLYYPSLVIDSRRRNIDVNLPHAIVYMYALSFGGMDLLEVMERTAAAGETYGDVADEFDMIIRDVEIFGADLYTAIRNARNLTPSDNLESFLDDLLSVLDSGGDMTGFLHEETEKYMDRAQNEQESFLDTLELLSEVFIVLFVAAPLFVVVIMMVMSFLGENTIPYLMLVIYAVIPLVMAAFLVVVSILSDPYKQPDHDLPTEDVARATPTADLRSVPGFDVFRGLRMRARIGAFLRAPLKPLYERPMLTLVATVPLAVVSAPLAAGLLSVPVEPSVLLDAPFEATLALLVVPFFVVAFPLSLFHEADRRRREAIAEQLPDTLDILASANQMGVPLVKGIDLVTKNVSGALATELRRTRNDMEWNYDIQNGLRGLADRVEVPQLTRTCNILAEGARSTGELHKVMSIAAEDTRHRFRLDRNRQQELNSYVAIVVIGFLVYMGVMVVLDQSFLGPITEQAATAGTGTQSPVQLDAENIDLYHALFFHSAVVQAVGTGLIAGKLTDNYVLSGLKYSIALVALSLVVFYFV